MAGKHEACRGHLKLGCGCRICARPDTNSTTKGVVSAAHLAVLEKFHAKMHRLEALRAKADAKRPKGDGLVDFDGKRIRPSRVPWARYEAAVAEYKAALAKRNRALALRSWVVVNAPNRRGFEHRGNEQDHYLRRIDGAWVNTGWRSGGYELVKCALCQTLIAKTVRFEAQLAKRQGDLEVRGDTEFEVTVPAVPYEPRKPEKQKPLPFGIPKSRLHKHTKACREPIPTVDRYDKRLGSVAYAKASGLTVGYVVDGQTIETPPHTVLNIEAVSDSRKGHYGQLWFPPSPLMVAFERCKINGAPIPAKRVPAIIARTYKRWLGRQVKARKAEAAQKAAVAA